jgi:predicted CoA-binding protein
MYTALRERQAPGSEHPEHPLRTALRNVLGMVLGFGTLNAFAGGYYGMSGAKDVPTAWLTGSPFSTYFIPGLILFVVVGGSLLTGAVAIFARWRSARFFALAAGVILLVWLAVQVSIIGYVSWMQPVTAIAGFAVLALASLLRPQTTTQGMTIGEAASQFLSERRIAVTGVSRHPQGHGSNVVYQRLRERGYEVFAVNPNADEVEGERCYHDLRSIPGGVTAVVIGTRPETAEATMRECTELGIKLVWMHRAFGAGSVSSAATALGRSHGITVIDGGCPCMFDPTADAAHKVMRPLLTLAGKVPRSVEGERPGEKPVFPGPEPKLAARRIAEVKP